MPKTRSAAPPPPTPAWQAALAAGAAHTQEEQGGIGTLQERTLHRAVKFWLAPDVQCHEVPVDGWVADIFDGTQVVEVQTVGLYPLQKKLRALLAHWPVTVVMPLPREKWVSWVDPDSGERTAPRRSPKRGCAADALPELWWVREFWRPQAYPHPLSVRILLLDMEEMRLQDGWGRDGKRGAHRIDRLPLDTTGEQWVRSTADIAALLPPLPPVFTRADLARALGRRGRPFSQALRLPEEVGAVWRTSPSRRGRCPMRRPYSR